MYTTKTTINLFFDKRRPNKSGQYPIMLTVYNDGIKKRYSLGLYLTTEEWEKLNSPRLKDDGLRKTRKLMDIKVGKAQSLIDELKPFSFEAFENGFFDRPQPQPKKQDLDSLFDAYIKQLEKEDRVGTAISYKTSKNSFTVFRKGLQLKDVTNDLLSEYEQWMKNEGKSRTTTGIYLRQLRAVINKAINDGMMAAESYPFKNFEIPAGRNVKKALSDENLKKLFDYIPKTNELKQAHSFWLLSYLLNGMNFKDIALLKPENLQEQHMVFYRQKSIHSRKKDLRPIVVALHPLAKNIIEQLRCKESEYLFPILKSGMTAYQVKYKVQDFIKTTNDHMKTVAKELGIDSKIGTYVARHSFSTKLLRSGAPVRLIQEALGHSRLETTENYLGSFPEATISEYNKMLTNFTTTQDK